MSLKFHEKNLTQSVGKTQVQSNQTEKVPSLATLAIHTRVDGASGEKCHHPVVNPIYLSTTYELDYPGQENVNVFYHAICEINFSFYFFTFCAINRFMITVEVVIRQEKNLSAHFQLSKVQNMVSLCANYEMIMFC